MGDGHENQEPKVNVPRRRPKHEKPDECYEGAHNTQQPQGESQRRTRTERGHGRFHRRFVLPDTVDSEKVNATGKDGVLTVTIPKQAKALPRRIRIAA